MILGKNSSCFQPLPMRSRILNAKVKADKFVLKVAKLEDAEKIHGIMVTVYEELENKENENKELKEDIEKKENLLYTK